MQCISLNYYLCQGRCVFVAACVSLQNMSKSYERILTIFSRKNTYMLAIKISYFLREDPFHFVDEIWPFEFLFLARYVPNERRVY